MEPRLQRRVQRYGWDKAAEFYEDSWKKQLKPAQDKLLEMAAMKPGDMVLETACGTGLITLQAASIVEPGGKIVATDLSAGMLKLAEKRAHQEGVNNVSFHRMDAEKLDLDENQFDGSLCGLGLMYVPDPVQALKEMFRVMKPGGVSVSAVWGERKNCGWAEIFPIVDRRVASDVCPLFFQQGTKDTLQKTFQEAGFQEVYTERLSVNLNYPTAEEAVMAAFAGGPVALAYQKFNSRTKEEAHQEYLNSITPYRNENGYEIPGEFVIVKGIK